MIRSGETVQEIDALRHAGLVGLRFDGVGDVRELTAMQVEAAITPTAEESAAQLRSRLMRFAVDVTVGDLLVIPNTLDREVWFAFVTGGYEFTAEPTVPGYAQAREASWAGWAERDAAWLRNKLQHVDTPAPILELRDPGWWFQQISEIDLQADRPVRPPRPSRPVPTARTETRSHRATSPRTPRAPRAPAVPKPPVRKEPERRLCAGQCGFQWNVTVLVDGLCPDCRSD